MSLKTDFKPNQIFTKSKIIIINMPSKTILTILVVLVCVSCVKKPVENKETVSANSVIANNCEQTTKKQRI